MVSQGSRMIIADIKLDSQIKRDQQSQSAHQDINDPINNKNREEHSNEQK